MLNRLRGYVYETKNLENGKLYIGLHSGHFDPHYLGSGTLLRRAIRKYGKTNFVSRPIAFASTIRELNELEKATIEEYRNRFGDTKIYNLLSGGFRKGLQGSRHSDLTKRKISLMQIGRRHSEETKKKMRLSQIGKVLSEETKSKIREALTGVKRGPHSEKTKNKIRLGNLGIRRKHKKETKLKISASLNMFWNATKNKKVSTISGGL